MRYRDLQAGVFITRDPAGFVDGPNVYTYVNQNPWTFFDPLGLEKIKVTRKNHHKSPAATWDENNLSKAVQTELDSERHRVGPAVGVKDRVPHRWNRAHITYNRIASEETAEFIAEWNSNSKNTKASAIRSAKEAKKFSDAMVARLDQNEYLTKFNKMMKANDGTTKKLNGMLDNWVKDGKIEMRHQSKGTRFKEQLRRAGPAARKSAGIGVIVTLTSLLANEANGQDQHTKSLKCWRRTLET